MLVSNKNSEPSESSQTSPEAQRRHPKRTTPEASVSLRHGRTSASAAEPNKAFTIPPKLQHGDPTRNRGPSSRHNRNAQVMWAKEIQQLPKPSTNDTDQESAINSNGSNERSVPDDWFLNWNTNVGDFNQPNSADDPARSHTLFKSSYPSMLPTQDSDDESEVYRSVIDDLTVKNKKLKRKLRKMERLHCSELNEEKLFEVRCYGLPPSRKQELQELLQKFAAELDGDGGVHGTKRSDAISTINPTSSTNPSSSSLLQNTDSAYATETRITSLDDNSVDASKAAKSQVQLPGMSKPVPNINPETQPVQFASERAKMKLVVRRLEQLFTGSDALQSELGKAEVQQQVAEAAAQEKLGSAADELAESGDEGDRREASMMSHQQDDDMTKGQDQDHRHSLDTSHQRPTRPMDLDPYRAQVAVDNVEYLEQMSYSSSLKQHHKYSIAGGITDWVYLNLINNMAQIHTLNVSLSFIKKAIRSMSDKLELSPDGNQVRWKGGMTGTRLSSDNDTSSSMMENSSSGEASPGDISSGAKSRGNPTPSDDKSLNPKAVSSKEVKSRLSQISSPGGATGPYSTTDNFGYRPLVFHSLTQQSSSADLSDQDSSAGDSDADSNNSGGPPPILDSGSNIEMGDIGKFAPLDGPVIYFGGAIFCTDLSAQIVFRDGGHTFPSGLEVNNYKRLVDVPLGASATEDTSDGEEATMSDLPVKVDWTSPDVEMDMFDDSDEQLPDLTLAPAAAEVLPTIVPPPLPFEVSGLADVRPDDNFVVYVKTQQVSTPVERPRPPYHSMPMDTDHQQQQHRDAKPGYDNEVIDAIQVNLEPSRLPEPSFAFLLSENSSDPFLSNSEELGSYESNLSFAYNVESDSRSSGEGIPSFHSPDLDDQSPMDLDAEEGAPLAPLSVVATAGTSDRGSVAGDAPSLKEIPILQSLDDMDIGGSEAV
ncbi:hypothetical protein ABW21_db0206589 [Orbilia brochopaga]|nr:hypothetical protein ABW21_db0206589 [Drechslerella brochopaga]